MDEIFNCNEFKRTTDALFCQLAQRADILIVCVSVQVRMVFKLYSNSAASISQQEFIIAKCKLHHLNYIPLQFYPVMWIFLQNERIREINHCFVQFNILYFCHTKKAAVRILRIYQKNTGEFNE